LPDGILPVFLHPPIPFLPSSETLPLSEVRNKLDPPQHTKKCLELVPFLSTFWPKGTLSLNPIVFLPKSFHFMAVGVFFSPSFLLFAFSIAARSSLFPLEGLFFSNKRLRIRFSMFLPPAAIPCAVYRNQKLPVSSLLSSYPFFPSYDFSFRHFRSNDYFVSLFFFPFRFFGCD